MSTITAIRLRAADASVTLVSNTPVVTDWSRRYFGPWWNAFPVPPPSSGTEPLVTAEADPALYAALGALAYDSPHEETIYAKARTLVARDGDDTIVAASPSEQLAYRSQPHLGRLTIAGCQIQSVALAAARLVREMVRGQLLRAGWAVLHSSAVVHGGRAVLTFGPKGAGKTTTALLLASQGWELLANDRVFVRSGPGGVEVAPWPAAAAIGLGLLDALGWYDLAHERLRAGERLHPTQDQRVTDALLAGERAPLWEQGGKRELKAQIFPDQFADWFGVKLSTGGHAAALLFPRIAADAAPALADREGILTEQDFMSGKTEDRYPDVFGLAQGIDGGGCPESRTAVADRLARLPHHSVALGHDIGTNADFLAKLIEAS